LRAVSHDISRPLSTDDSQTLVGWSFCPDAKQLNPLSRGHFDAECDKRTRAAARPHRARHLELQ
jgi:hypothetical protein